MTVELGDNADTYMKRELHGSLTRINSEFNLTSIYLGMHHDM